MEFRPLKRDFPTMVHKRIYMEAAFIIPLEASLKGQTLPSGIAEGCREYYDFLHQLLSQIYEDPIKYGLPAGAFEEYLNGEKPNAKKRKDPSRYDKFRSVTYNAGNTYQKYIYEFCRAADLVENKLIVNQEKYHRILHMFHGDKKQKQDDFIKGVPYQLRLQRFADHGLAISEIPEGAMMEYAAHPEMLPAMKAAADGGTASKPFDWYGIHYCEFRQLYARYIPSLEDVIHHLDLPDRTVLEQISQYLIEHGAKPSISTFHKADYKYHGVQIAQIQAGEENTFVRINGAYWWWQDGEQRINEQLLRRDSEFQEYAHRHVNYCTGCSTSHEHGGYVTILGHQKCLCGGIDFKVFYPSSSDLPMIKELLDIRMELTDQMKERKGA